MAKQYQIGVIGLGVRGSLIASDLENFSRGQIRFKACVEINEDMYSRACGKYGYKPTCYATIEEMLTKETLDGIVISTPHDLHAENLETLKNETIPLLLEKPLDSSLDRICKVVELSKAYSGEILVGHCMRFAPILQSAKDLIKSGEIGSVRSFRLVQNCHYGNVGYCTPWRRKTERSGSWLVGKATHDLDILLWIMGSVPKDVFASSKLTHFGGNKSNELRCRDCDEILTCPESTVQVIERNHAGIHDEFEGRQDYCVFASEIDLHDNDHVLIELENGCSGTYVQCYYTPRNYRHRVYEFYGSGGVMEVDLGAEKGGKISICKRNDNAGSSKELVFDYNNRNHYDGDRGMCLNFLNMMRGTEKPFATVEHAFAAEMLGYAADKSAKERKLVNINEMLVPKKEKMNLNAYE